MGRAARASGPRLGTPSRVPVAMYSVLKSGKGATEEQTLARLNEQCNRLLRATEADVEHGELERCRRTEPRPRDRVFGIPKPGEDMWMVRDGEDGVKTERDTRTPRDGHALPGTNSGHDNQTMTKSKTESGERLEKDGGWWPSGPDAGTEDTSQDP